MNEHLFAATTPGLEGALLAECLGLDRGARLLPGGVDLSGPPGFHRRANLLLRTASWVQLRIGEVPAQTPEVLRRHLAQVPLGSYLVPGETPIVSASARGSRLPAGLIARVGREAWPSTGIERLEIHLHGEGEWVEVRVDTSGELLHRRGYRQEVSRAPLRETLAAGMLALSSHDPRVPLWDPLCGSGTLPIEAALRALRRAPGRSRSFAFERWPAHDPAAWEREKLESDRQALQVLPAPIWATDIHAGALGQARRNARRVGMLERLRFERHDATVPWALPGTPGLVVGNLPYGKRVGDPADLPQLARSLGAALRAEARGWRFGLLVADASLQVDLALRVEQRLQLENGGIGVTLLIGSVP